MSNGFTLIELMITVAIVAILASIAYPAYTNAMLKGRRAEGRSGLTALMQQEERYFTQNGKYLGFNGPSDSNVGNPPVLKVYSGDGSNSAYTLGAAQCANVTGVSTCVVVFAKPVRTDLTCGTLVIQSAGLVRGYGSLTVSGSGDSTALSNSINPVGTSGCW